MEDETAGAEVDRREDVLPDRPHWKAETFKFSTDPELEAKIRDVVGLYLTWPPSRTPPAPSHPRIVSRRRSSNSTDGNIEVVVEFR